MIKVCLLLYTKKGIINYVVSKTSLCCESSSKSVNNRECAEQDGLQRALAKLASIKHTASALTGACSVQAPCGNGAGISRCKIELEASLL